MKGRFLPLALLLLMGAGCLGTEAKITSFEECAAAGNPVMESYPRQCRAGGETFVEAIAVPPTPPEPTKEEPAAGEKATLKAGESKTFEGGLKVTLKSINDSRCPKDVQCIWAGELAAILTVELAASGEEPLDLRLGQTTETKAVAYGRTFTLEAIDESSATISVARS